MEFGTVLYEARDRVATITLNRPERFNAISLTMPDDIAAAFEHAGDDDAIQVVVLAGAGRGFCGGYDLKAIAETAGETSGVQAMPWDPTIDFRFMGRCTQKFMSIWRCRKPLIARVQRDAVAGGSDIAPCADIIVMADQARAGYPPARLWGCPTTAMWVYRLGAERAKHMLFTGDLITGVQAKAIGLSFDAVPIDALDAAVQRLTDRIRGVPKSQLTMMKMLVNQAYEEMGLASPQSAPSRWRRCSTASPATARRACGSSGGPRPSASSRRWPSATPAIRFQAARARMGPSGSLR